MDNSRLNERDAAALEQLRQALGLDESQASHEVITYAHQEVCAMRDTDKEMEITNRARALFAKLWGWQGLSWEGFESEIRAVRNQYLDMDEATKNAHKKSADLLHENRNLRRELQDIKSQSESFDSLAVERGIELDAANQELKEVNADLAGITDYSSKMCERVATLEAKLELIEELAHKATMHFDRPVSETMDVTEKLRAISSWMNAMRQRLAGAEGRSNRLVTDLPFGPMRDALTRAGSTWSITKEETGLVLRVLEKPRQH